ncbi:hypothetical protein QJS10_CPB13g01276 [Acorus calamus]|uniref:Uncharacterized protein n=1 Tax=Acorus calamus TaxID=4465 RepID=A0AAV9DF01_ACOCL|nr:hypothetical protein QJS10_CPB13g01276 [Acorus calamus]
MTRNDVTIGKLVGELVSAEGTERPHGGWQIGARGRDSGEENNHHKLIVGSQGDSLVTSSKISTSKTLCTQSM